MIPELYWMLECTECGSRLVVYDSYLELVGEADPNDDGGGYGGLPLPERHTCADGCRRPMRAVGSIDDLQDDTMWLHDPHLPIKLTRVQMTEWRRLIQEPGYTGNPDVTFTALEGSQSKRR
jgi:hypothetical protein